MKKIVLLLVLYMASFANAQKFNLSVDYAVFKHDDNRIRFELYYSFPDNSISYYTINDNIVGKVKIKFKITSNIKTEIQDEWEVVYSVKSIKDLNKMGVFGTKNFVINPGEYTISISAIDINDSTKFAQKEFRIVTNKFDNEKISISDIELASIIEQESTPTQNWNKIFLKNSLYIIPNPNIEVSGNELKIKAYYEIYGAKLFASDSFRISYYLFDALKNEKLYFSKIEHSKSDALIDLVEIPIDALPTGVYYLKVVASYPISGAIDSSYSMKKMYVLNSFIAPELKTEFTENEMFDKSEFSTYLDERADLELKMARKIAQNFEKDEMDLLGTNKAKQKYLFRFWKIRDIDKDSKKNEALDKFRESIQYANTYFSYSKYDGWSTDRGEIYLKYGKPSNREQNMATGENKAYEEWWYQNVKGGASFYFVDLLGLGNFQLIHSTLSEYPYNPNWFKEFVQGKKIEANTPNSNSKSGQRTQ